LRERERDRDSHRDRTNREEREKQALFQGIVAWAEGGCLTD